MFNTEFIFNVKDDEQFLKLALDIFRFQYFNNSVYRNFTDALGINPRKVDDLKKIPFLPIEFFKSHSVQTGDFKPEIIFTSSGTTGMSTSKHNVKEAIIYKESLMNGFEYFWGSPKDFVLLALLPSYLEREGSSLVYMAEELIKTTGHPSSGFYLHNYQELSLVLNSLKNSGKKVLLLGVTYALLDLAEQFPIDFPDLMIMETGGMKGNRKEMVREELHNQLKKAFGVKEIYSEYGMTELLSQAYSKGNEGFDTPPWMKILIRDVNDPLSYVFQGQTGGINVIDLANLYSCSFIATQDLGRIHSSNIFEVLGRFDNSDVRGCNLLVQ
ncbi:MAG: acyltransferase [Bacteroidales bacterium]|nr:acyltransferase [Bacteroidales bacterium]